MRKGDRYGRWMVIAIESRSHALCRCDCGAESLVQRSNMYAGKSTSCGCGPRGRAATHGKSHTPTWRAWASTRNRCENPNNQDFKYYGGRGIRVCERWQSFESFIADMGDRPPGHTLDRIDPNGHYEPGNCRWATRAQQSRNTRSNKLSAEDVTRMRGMRLAGSTYTQLATEFGVSWSHVRKVITGRMWKEADIPLTPAPTCEQAIRVTRP